MKVSLRTIERGMTTLALIMVIVLSVEIAAKYEVDFAVPRSPPTTTGLTQLEWIRNHFGYDNRSVIIVIRDTNSYLWALAYNGGLIYFGNLLYLLANQTDYGLLTNTNLEIRSDYIGSIQRLWVYGALQGINSGKYLIVVPTDLYKPDALEIQALSTLSGGVLRSRQVDHSYLQGLFESWNRAKSTNDLLGNISPYVNIYPLANCLTYSNWVSTNGVARVMIVQNFTNISTCSLHVIARVTGNAVTKIALNGTWNLLSDQFLGFYFKGTSNSTGQYYMEVTLKSSSDPNSYYYYNFTDKSIWDGAIHGFVLELSQFQAVGVPGLSSISAIDFEISSSEPGVFDYGLQYLMTASSNGHS